MNAWLDKGSKYIELSFSHRGQAYLQRGKNHGFRKAIVEQATRALGGAPSSWRWELDGANVLIVAGL